MERNKNGMASTFIAGTMFPINATFVRLRSIAPTRVSSRVSFSPPSLREWKTLVCWAAAPLHFGAGSEYFDGEVDFEIPIPRSARRHRPCVSRARRHRHPVVARDVGRARQAGREARLRLQCIAVRIPDRGELQVELHR